MPKITVRPLIAAFVLIITLTIIMVASTASSFASSDFTTKSFNVRAEASNAHVISIREKITVDFKSGHHGITRYIPVQSRYYKIKNIKTPGFNNDIEYKSDYKSSYELIRIGNADEYLTGVHTFTLSYDMVCYRDDSKTEDYLSLDLLPSGWDTSIGSAKLTLIMPEKMDWSQAKFYAGAYGTEGSLSPYFKKSINGNTLTITGKNVPEEYGVTVNSALKEGYWVNPANRDAAGIFMWIALIAIPILVLILWLLFGRDPKIVKTVEFYPPEGMTPAEIGYIIDGSIDNRDLSSMLMYYAEKGYLSIKETDRGVFEVNKLKDIDDSEKLFAKVMFESMFSDGDTVNLNEMSENFGNDLIVAKDELKGYYDQKDKKLFKTSANVCRVLGDILMFVPAVAGLVLTSLEAFNYTGFIFLIPTGILLLIGMFAVQIAFDKHDTRTKAKNIVIFALGMVPVAAGIVIASLITGIEAGSWIPGAGVCVSMVITYFFVLMMKARTEQSAKWQGQILGFRDFIRDAEYDKLKALSDESPEYFYNIMPYAYVMGMDTKWAKKFDNIKISQPNWYTSYDTGNFVFTAMWYTSMMSTCSRSFSGNFMNGTLPDNGGDIGGFGGGSGFGGGGFSGGGFGGGGGGAW